MESDDFYDIDEEPIFNDMPPPGSAAEDPLTVDPRDLDCSPVYGDTSAPQGT